MGETVVRFTGAPEIVLEKLVALGYYQTKTEALRAGVMHLGKEFNVSTGAKEIEDELAIRKMQKVSAEIESGKRKLVPLDAVLEKYGTRR